MQNGGNRPGAGRPKGSKNRTRKSLEKKKVEDNMRQRVMGQAQRLISAQMSLALGCQMLFRIDQVKGLKGQTYNKKPVMVTDQEEIIAYLNGETKDDDSKSYYFITMTPPDNKAVDSLLDRTFGKARQNIDLNPIGSEVQESLSLIQQLMLRRNANTGHDDNRALGTGDGVQSGGKATSDPPEIPASV